MSVNRLIWVRYLILSAVRLNPAVVTPRRATISHFSRQCNNLQEVCITGRCPPGIIEFALVDIIKIVSGWSNGLTKFTWRIDPSPRLGCVSILEWSKADYLLQLLELISTSFGMQYSYQLSPSSGWPEFSWSARNGTVLHHPATSDAGPSDPE